MSSTGGHPIWIDSTLVSDGVTLTLAAGVVLRGIPTPITSYQSQILGGDFDIVAIGTVDAPIRIESVVVMTDGIAWVQHAELSSSPLFAGGGGLYAYTLSLEDSIITDVTVEPGLDSQAAPGPCTLRRNVFLGHALANLQRCENATAEYNYFADTTYPLQVSQATVVRYNTLHSVFVSPWYIPVGGTVVLENNYWGTTNTVDIQDNRIDLTYAPGATVDFLPILTSPHVNTPTP